MKKETVTLINPFDYTELTAISEYLSKKETEEGLKLISFRRGKFVFQKSVPQNTRYSAVICNSGDKAGYFADCESKGWNFVTSDEKLLIFRTCDSCAKELKVCDKASLKSTVNVVSTPAILLIFCLWRFVKAVFLRNDYEATVLTDAASLTGLVMVSAFAVYSVLKLMRYTLWRIKAERNLKNGEDVRFYNLKEANATRFIDNIGTVIIGAIWLVAAAVIYGGYYSAVWPIWVVGVAYCVLVFVPLLGRILSEIKHRPRNYAFLAVLVAVIMTAVFGAAQISESRYEAFEKTKLNYNGIPVSLTDFGIDEENCRDKTSVENLSPFAQHYIFGSRVTDEYESEERPFFYYEVFTSESEKARDGYEKKLRKRLEKFNSSIEQLSDTCGWDVLYREIHDGKAQDAGYGIKDDIIVYLDVCGEVSFEEFFSTASRNIIN